MKHRVRCNGSGVYQQHCELLLSLICRRYITPLCSGRTRQCFVQTTRPAVMTVQEVKERQCLSSEGFYVRISSYGCISTAIGATGRQITRLLIRYTYRRCRCMRGRSTMAMARSARRRARQRRRYAEPHKRCNNFE